MNEMIRNRPLTPLSPRHDPWDPIRSLTQYGKHVLTSVEMTVTHLCNMRCEHCAVGDALAMSEGELMPLAPMLRRLDEVEHLETISITGGEPTFRLDTVRRTILPLLRYAKERGVRTQLNSNITLDLERYEELAPYLDVLHISYNYRDAGDFHQVGFAKAARPVGAEASAKLFERMVENARALADGGLFVSAESMINYRTWEHLPEIHRMIVEMGCKRHEVHPMYPSAFAKDLPLITLDQLRSAIHGLLDTRDPGVWMLFGTLPFFACSMTEEDRRLVERLRREPNVTVRNDPDGRNRLNVNLFNGDIYVTDFADFPALGNIGTDRLDEVFGRWLEHPLAQSVGCHCPQAACCGPNLLVAHTYYRDVDFTKRSAIV
ncbi:radical SAM/CxCxxxxC motif protein YfkAB [Gorillibacterium sp. sgz5001074]|uniref:radical SAM/CxCxxxxC motif protein YfkAB n=1 Tax=Gorillibacterium sp. sgz5001074 TaxID=3446695 RepID=UPI003F669F7E